MNIIEKIEKAGLVGRGGAEYPTAKKWQDVHLAPGNQKYVICNASEGEIGLFKDIFILENYTEQVIRGMILAMEYLETKDAFFNINEKYYHQIESKLLKTIDRYNQQGYNIQVFIEEPSYIGGEETALLNAIEGKRTEPRLKPPFPSRAGLYGKPTLINNVETFYNIACVDNNTFDATRFFSISGKIENPGVYQLPDDITIGEALKQTNNLPDFDFFVQIGGSASGLVLSKEQIKERRMIGGGGLEVYDKTTPPKEVVLRWLEFYQKESCGKCTPCRVGTYQLYNLVKNNSEIPWNQVFEILETLKETSFCALGKSVEVPIASYYKNVL